MRIPSLQGLVRLVACLLLTFATSAGAVPNLLDPTFGDGGGVLTVVGPFPEGAHDLVVDGAGRIVLAGGSQDGAALVRHLADGALDATFGTGGIVESGIAGTFRAVAVDGTGRIFAAGASCGFYCHLLLVRYLQDGALDPTFGAGGVVMVPVRGSSHRRSEERPLAGWDLTAESLRALRR